MKIDLDAFAFVLNTKVEVNSFKDSKGKNLYSCRLKNAELCLGDGKYSPVESVLRFNYRSEKSARHSCARNIRGQLIRLNVGVSIPSFQYHRVPDVLTA